MMATVMAYLESWLFNNLKEVCFPEAFYKMHMSLHIHQD